MAECNCGTGSLPIIKQGDAYAVQVSLTFNGEPIDSGNLDLIEEIEFTFGELAPMRFKPKDIYNTTIGAFLVPLTQKQTFMLEDGKILVDCRVQFYGGDVVGVSRMVRVFVREALSWEILPEKPYHEITPPDPGDVLVLPLTVTSNGTYTAPSGKAYSPVTVNVPQGSGDVVRASWHQCPEAVREYLAEAIATYPTNGGATIVDQYAPQSQTISETVSKANSKPIGYTVDGATFYNEIPNVQTPFATESQAGTVKPLDWLRWINTTLAEHLPGSIYRRGYNCRDLGGWPCDGGTIRYGMLIRGSEPNAVDKDLMVDQIGVKTEVQLLPLSEQATDYKMKSPWGIDWEGNDTENTKVYSPEDVSDPAKKALWAKILKAIIDSVNHAKPVYFHCGVGADRTGVTAMILEGILGVNSDNVDIEFELTNFAIGWSYPPNQTEVYRGREYPTYIDLKRSFSAIPLVGGLSDTFRNHCVSFALSLGITIDEINAFRSAMIDGTPDVITPTLTTYTISKSGSHVAYDNDTASVSETASYSVGVTPTSGYVISDVSVTMGGTDITSQAFSGTPTARRVSVTNTLSNCLSSNASSVAEVGTAYAATITAAAGYTLDGATVQITMGGTNVSQYYSNGTINIPSVTGDVVISVTAVESARQNLFDPVNARYNKRAGLTGGDDRELSGGLVTNMIDITDIDSITVEGITEVLVWTECYAGAFYYAGSTYGQDYVGYQTYTTPTYVFDVAAYKAAHPTATHLALYLGISTSAISAADVANLAIYAN